MASFNTPISIRLSTPLLEGVDEMVAKMGISRPEAVRQCVALALPFIVSGVAPNPQRSALVGEYNQIALEIILNKIAPEFQDEVYDAALRRMGEFHGTLGTPLVNSEIENSEAQA